MKKWTKWLPPQQHLMPASLSTWLLEQGSLTRRLQQHVEQTFSVDLISNQWCQPLLDEKRALSLPLARYAFGREVRLLDGDNALVYARTVIPAATYHALKQRFTDLGTRPLGEMLFTEPTVVRDNIEIAQIRPGQYLYQLALKKEKIKPDMLWGRRSRFYLAGKVLLVSEIFLPSLLWRME